ncbi:MAG: hypothetical protein ACRD3W_25145, partial [Terriglobales bacterium]
MPNSPILFVHVCGGVLGIVFGAGAMLFRKGSRRHGLAGNLFFVSMLCMSVFGVYLALLRSETHNVFGGTLTFYLVTTAWMTARRRDGKAGAFEFAAFLVAATLGTAIVGYGLAVAKGAVGKGGNPAVMFFVLGSIALLCAAGDLRVLVRGGIFGAQRISRHLWRMCFALFIAAGSLFLARPQLFPPIFQTTHL